MYFKEYFNDDAKLGLLRKDVMKVQDFAAFAIYRGAAYYESFKKVVNDFDVGRRAFKSAKLAGPFQNFTHGMEVKPKQDVKTPQLLILPDGRTLWTISSLILP